MPKIIENVKEKAVAEARRELLGEGYNAMTIRRVAAAIGIGTGTIYNYFPSKEYLAACVMLEDWQEMTSTFQRGQESGDARETIRRLFDLVRTYTERFRSSWEQYAEQESAFTMRHRYHTVLIRQLEQHVAAALPQETGQAKPWLSAFLAELILRFGTDGRSGYEAIAPAVEALLS